MASEPRARRIVAAALAAALGACGTGLYDAAGVPRPPPPGLTCDAGQVVCASVCVEESATHCGAACDDCTAAGPPPAHGAFACLPGGVCGYACDDGWLKCDGGCCGTTALAAGPAFTCALLDDGSVRCWGANDAGQLGDGTTIDRPTPVRAQLPAAAIAVGAGTSHACAVLAGGVVTCWGANGAGQVSGSPTSGAVPIPATTPVTAGGAAVAAGAGHTCALLSTGAVTCWGGNASGQLGPGPGVPVASGATALACGADHACALVAGAVKCWGAGGAGQLGGSPVSGIATPIAAGAVALAASAGQTCASTGLSNGGAIDDVVKCWGDSLGATFLLSDPQPTPAIPMKDASQSTVRYAVPALAVGRKHVCVEKKTESLECFGADAARGQLGGTPIAPSEAVAVPLPVTAPALRAFAAGGDHACAALGDGRLRCWGGNDRGQLGDGTSVDPGVGAITSPSGR